MVGLYKDPKGDTIFKKSSAESPTIGVTSDKMNEYESQVINLKRRVKELEDEARTKEVSVKVAHHDNFLCWQILQNCKNALVISDL